MNNHDNEIWGEKANFTCRTLHIHIWKKVHFHLNVAINYGYHDMRSTVLCLFDEAVINCLRVFLSFRLSLSLSLCAFAGIKKKAIRIPFSLFLSIIICEPSSKMLLFNHYYLYLTVFVTFFFVSSFSDIESFNFLMETQRRIFTVQFKHCKHIFRNRKPVTASHWIKIHLKNSFP